VSLKLSNNSGDIGMAKPTQADAEAAVRVLIEWTGDDPSRGGLQYAWTGGAIAVHRLRYRPSLLPKWG